MQVIQTRGRHINVLVIPFGFGIQLWTPVEFLGPGMAVAVVGLRIIPLFDQWMGSALCLYCGRQDSEGINGQTGPRQELP